MGPDMVRWLLPLLALLGLVFAGPHAAAMAMPTAGPAAEQAMAAEASPCHSEAVPEKPVKAPESCCPDGCMGQCAPVLTLAGAVPIFLSDAALTVSLAEPNAAAPDDFPQAHDRPPRLLA